jgi:hypothetical protein
VLYVPHAGGAFEWATANILTRPTPNYGTSITPGNNTFPAYVSLISGANVLYDVWGIRIVVNSVNVSASAKDCLVNIGIDEAGGTSFTTKIANLICSNATSLNTGGVVQYYFPLKIAAGSSIGAQASVNNATVGTVRVWITIFGRPTNPEYITAGSYVTSIGAVTASSAGTAVTAGTTSEGAWTLLGTPTVPHWWWQCGFGINNATMALLQYAMDLSAGDGTNQRNLITDLMVTTTTTESVGYNNYSLGQCEADVPANTGIYGRLWCSGTPDTGVGMIAYGLGG